MTDVGSLPEENPFPGARTNLLCGDCGAPLELKLLSNGVPFYGCTHWPDCKGFHGARRDGAPRGAPANKDTRRARVRAHTVFDQIWKRKFVKNRSDAYKWMRKAMGLTHSQAHIALFNQQQCEILVESVYKAFPPLQTRYSRLMFDE